MDPPPTAQPWKMVACLKNWMLKKPRRPRLGRQIQRWMDQLLCGRFSGVQRRPISMTATLYPFSASRRAETLPPKPEPMTMKSKSNWWSWCSIQVPTGKLSLIQQATGFQWEALSKKWAEIYTGIGGSGAGLATTVRTMLSARCHQPWKTCSAVERPPVKRTHSGLQPLRSNRSEEHTSELQ